MSKIKTRETVKNIKTLDKAAAAGEHMKNALIRTKDTAENLSTDDRRGSPSQYAEEKVQYAAEDAARDTAHLAVLQGRKLAHKGREVLRDRRNTAKEPEQEPQAAQPQQRHDSAPQQHRQSVDTRHQTQTPQHESGLQPIRSHVANEDVPIVRERQSPTARVETHAEVVNSPQTPERRDATLEGGRRYAQRAAQHRASDSRKQPKTLTRTVGRPIESAENEQPQFFPVERGRHLAQNRAKTRARETQQAKFKGDTPDMALDSAPHTVPASASGEPQSLIPGRGMVQERGYRAVWQTRQAENSADTKRAFQRLSSRIKTAREKERTIKQTARSSGKNTVKTARGTIKTTEKAVKTAEQTSKTAIKTAQATAKTAQKSAQAAAKTAKASAQAARAAAKAAVVTAKAVAKAVATAVKAIGAAVKELIAAIAAGGWVAVVVIVVICLIGLIVASPFGIFFAGNNKDTDTVPVSAAVAQVNFDFNSQLETLQAGEYDDIDISGSMADWPEVLAVFAVRVAGSEDVDAMDVATMDPTRVAKLKEVFWDMNSLTSTVETIDHPDSDPDDDVDDSWTERILHITITAKTAEDMKIEYRFSEKQKTVLDELLENRDALLDLIGDLMNSTRPREYDGSHIVFSGMNPEITLREHQKNAIAHVLYGGNTLLAHEVGAGKTLDVDVAKLKIMKADHQSKQFRLEDNLLKYFPEKIEESKGFIRGLEADMQTLAAHPLPVEGFIGMEIRGDKLTDKENAGAALLDACKEVKGKDPVQIGSYRGFAMSVAFDSFQQEYTLTLRGQMTHRVELGTDARGNLVRIENALEKMPERLRNVQDQLENLYNQQAAAKAEVGKPFPQERELAEKTARLIELDMELNLDSKGQAQPEQIVAKSVRPSVLDKLKAPPVRGTQDKPHKKEMEVR